MTDLSEGLTLFFEHVSAKRISEARMMINTPSLWGVGRLGQGRRAALEGIINLLNAKSDTSVNFEKLKRLAETFSKRMNTIWCDEFDKGYFEVWIKFIEFNKKRRPKENR